MTCASPPIDFFTLYNPLIEFMSPNFSTPRTSRTPSNVTRNLAVISAKLLTTCALLIACIFSFGGMKAGGPLDTRYLALVCTPIPPKGNPPSHSRYQIDTSNISSTVSGVTYHGLPDSHDFSKHKDVFAIYLYGYCSGVLQDTDAKDDGKRYEIDFCSRPGTELFAQYRL
jgi:hypothetical protein